LINWIFALTPNIREWAYSEIQDIVHGPVSVFTPEDQASKVLGVLKKSGRYEAAVKSSKTVGLITVRDLLAVDQPEQTKVDKLWRATGTANPYSSVFEVVQKLIDNSIRALPVVEDDQVTGIISQMDILMALSDSPELEGYQVRDMVKNPVWSLESEDSISNARRIMLNKGISHIPVTKNGKLEGMITASMIVHTFINPAGRATTGGRGGGHVQRFPGKISGFMESNPVTIGPDGNLLEALRMMIDKDESACIIVDNEKKIIGILTPRELLSPLLGLQIEEGLPVYIMGLTDEDFFEKAIAEEKVRRIVNKGLKFRPDITEVSVRIKKGKSQGNRIRYEVIGRALSPDGQINATANGWGLLAVFDELCGALGKAISRTKPERKPRTRRSRSR